MVSFINKIYLSDNLNSIVKNYDIVICAAPLTKKTEQMLDYNFFKQMKKILSLLTYLEEKLSKQKIY